MLNLQYADAETRDNGVIVRLTGMVDPYNFEGIIQQLEVHVRTEKPDWLLMDFAGVGYLQSSALGQLTRIVKVAKKADTGFQVCNLTSNNRKVLKVTRLDQLIDVYTTEDAALAKWQKRQAGPTLGDGGAAARELPDTFDQFVSKPDDQKSVEHHPWGRITWTAGPGATPSSLLRVGRVEIEARQSMPFHRHPDMEEVVYVVAGQVEQWIDRKSTTLGQGDSATIPQNAVHAIRNSETITAELLMVHCPARHESESTVDVSKSEPWKSLALKGKFPDFDIRAHKGTLLARLTNRDLIHQNSIEDFRGALADLDGAYSPTRMVLDFSGTRILSSAVLGVLMERYQSMSGGGRQLCVCGLSKETQEVFDMTQLSRCIHTYPDAKTAVADGE